MALDTGNDLGGRMLHEGLEYFLWKMSLPNTPSYNINTDIKYSVRLWFHNGIGNIMSNPFLSLVETEYGNFTRNFEFKEHAHRGLQLNEGAADGEGIELGDFCFDLTPFVQSIQLPDIGTSAATQVDTLLGTMQVGSFSPYSSDGGREVTFQMLDTQHSILDAIFYPWLKMIGNAKWYDPAHAYEQHTTPYPICTIEIATPMRWAPEPGNTEKEAKLTPYVYQYLGARPKTYDIPEINAESRSTLTRRLTMVCDLVIVDMNKDSLMNKIREEKDMDAQPTPAGIATPAPGGAAPHAPVGAAPPAPDASPENAPTPAPADVDAAKNDAQTATDEKDAAMTDAQTQAGGGEPGAADDTGPQPTDPPLPPPGPDPVAPVSSDAEAPVATDTPPPPEPPAPPAGRDNGGGDGPGARDGGGGDNGGGDNRGGTGPGDGEWGGNGTGNNPLVTAMPARGLRADPTKSDLVCSAIKRGNDDWFATMTAARNCIVQHGSDYVESSIMGRMNEELPQQFDTMLVTPILNCAKDPSSFVKIQDALTEFSDATTEPSLHHYDFHLSDAKAIGQIVEEVQPEGVRRAPLIGNYGRVNTLRNTLQRLNYLLPKLDESAAEAFFALKSMEMLERSPNNSMALHHEFNMSLWPVGMYLTPLHNELVTELGTDGDVLQTESYPFLFRHSIFKHSYSDIEAFATLKDALKMCNTEATERSLGKDPSGNDCYMESVSVWEIIDGNLNHTGTYWCKAWIVRKNAEGAVVSGQVVICKLNYMGNVLTDPIEFDAETMRPISEGNDYAVISRSMFSRSSMKVIFSDDNAWEVKKGGQSENDFNPLTATTRSKSYSFTTEYVHVDGTRDDGTHDNLRPTDYVHIEEWPRQGDPEANMDSEGFYTISSLDESGMLTQTHYRVSRATAYEVQKEIDDEPREVLPLRMGQGLSYYHTTSGKYARLMVKRHDCWNGVDSTGEPYKTVHTTNAAEDMFEQYIPTSVDYVAQYRHHKTRWRAAREELKKMRQMLGRLGAKIVQLSNEMKDSKDFVSGMISVEDVKKLLAAESRMEEISKTYNILIEVEIKQENSLNELKTTHRVLTSKYNNTPHTDLPSRLSVADDLHLQTLSISRVEQELKSVREKQAEMQAEYQKAIDDKNEAIARISDDIEAVCSSISFCMLNSWLSSPLTDGYGGGMEYLRCKEDRMVKMERLIAFFDEGIKQIEKAMEDDPATVQLKDVILECDWKAWGDWAQEETPEVERIRRAANELGYKLRVKKLIPKLTARAVKLTNKYDKMREELEDSTRLVYDNNYAYPGYVPKDDSQQTPYVFDGKISSEQVAVLEKIIAEYRELIRNPGVRDHEGEVATQDPLDSVMDSMSAEYSSMITAPGDRGSILGAKDMNNIEYLNGVVSDYKSMMAAPGDREGGMQKSQTLEWLDSVIGEYRKMLKGGDVHGAAQPREAQPDLLSAIISSYKALLRGQGKSARVGSVQTVTFEDAKADVLGVYRKLQSGFEQYSDAELENSLLLVLASAYLQSDSGKQLHDEIVSVRSDVEMSKRMLERFKKSSDDEMQLVSAAKQKCSSMEAAIDRLDKENERIVRLSSGDLNRDEYRNFRLNSLKKVDLQQSLDSAKDTMHSLLDHYENKTLKVLEKYAASLSDLRAKYDKLMEGLEETIGFRDKVLQLHEVIKGLP